MSAHATAHAVETPGMRDRILDAADRLFYAHGIQSIGVDAVVLEAGISKRTLYKHFGSREQLVAAYLERRGARQPEMPKPGDELHEILGVFKRFERWFASDEFRGCPFSNAIAELGGDAGASGAGGGARRQGSATPRGSSCACARSARRTRRRWPRSFRSWSKARWRWPCSARPTAARRKWRARPARRRARCWRKPASRL